MVIHTSCKGSHYLIRSVASHYRIRRYSMSVFQHPVVAVAQICSTSDVERNYQFCAQAAERARRFQAKILCLPECFAYMGEQPGDSCKMADTLDGPLFTRYKELARENGIWLSCGGFHEKIKGNDTKVYNSHVILDDKGEIKAVYRKLHMFKVDIKGGVTLDENSTTLAGKDIVVVDSPIGRLGLSTCYDIRFPELYTSLRAAGAEVILVPSAFTVPTGRDHWEVLVRARGIETQTYVVAAAQFGQHNSRRVSYGRSLIVDPWGTTVVCCPDVQPTVSIGEVNADRIAQVRESMPVFSHRRQDIFGPPIRSSVGTETFTKE